MKNMGGRLEKPAATPCLRRLWVQCTHLSWQSSFETYKGLVELNLQGINDPELTIDLLLTALGSLKELKALQLLAVELAGTATPEQPLVLVRNITKLRMQSMGRQMAEAFLQLIRISDRATLDVGLWRPKWVHPGETPSSSSLLTPASWVFGRIQNAVEHADSVAVIASYPHGWNPRFLLLARRLGKATIKTALPHPSPFDMIDTVTSNWKRPVVLEIHSLPKHWAAPCRALSRLSKTDRFHSIVVCGISHYARSALRLVEWLGKKNDGAWPFPNLQTVKIETTPETETEEEWASCLWDRIQEGSLTLSFSSEFEPWSKFC